MIQAFVGLVGGGKSFCSVRRMCSYMASGGRCVSNIRLTGWDDQLGDLSDDSPVIPFLSSIGWRYQPKQYGYIPYDEMVSNPLWYQRIPQGQDRDHRTLCVIDEATDLFDSLDGGKLRQDSTYRQLFHFLRLSRHAHIDVLFVCQDISTINTRLRALVANVWKSTDMRNFRIGIFKFGFPFDVFMLQLFDRTGKYLIQREYVRKDKRIFGLYESETFGGCLGVKWDGVSVSASNGVIKKELKKMSMFWKVAFLLLASMVGWLVYRDLNRPSVTHETVVVSNVVERVSRPVSASGFVPLFTPPTNSHSKDVSPPSKPSEPTTRYIRGSFKFVSCGPEKYVLFDDAVFREGCPCEFGRVVVLDRNFVYCSDNGTSTYLLPLESPDTAPSARLTSSADGAATGGKRRSWYYVHTRTDKE